MGVAGLDRVLGLRPPRSLDVEAIAAIAGDARTSQYIPAGALTLEASRELVQAWMDDWARDAVGGARMPPLLPASRTRP